MKRIWLCRARRPEMVCAWTALILTLASEPARGQSIGMAWSGHGHDAQHSGISQFAAQPLHRIRWQTPVDLAPQYSGNLLHIHYGSPLLTRANTVIIPVKTNATDGFRIEARDAADGSLKWVQATDYSLPSATWVPSCNLALTPKSRLYFPGAGGTVYFRDAVDSTNPVTGQIAFYGLSNYLADAANFNASVKINTPITSDRYGNIFFGFIVLGATTPPLQNGVARIAVDGTGSWISAGAASGESSAFKVGHNCAPALANDHRTLYVGLRPTNSSSGILAALDSRTLAPITRVRLKDVVDLPEDARISDIATSSPLVGPDGDVYYGVIEALGANFSRGWLLHFDRTLSETKVPGGFGWDVTPSVVPSSMVPWYHGASPYLLLCKYNNYAWFGGGGDNKMALLDPNDSTTNSISGARVMKEILTILGPTPDEQFPFPGAVKEWCINAAAVDPFTKCAIVHSEDGKVYRWDLVSQSLSETLRLTDGLGAAYTPTVIGRDGTVYVIANATLFAIGQ